MSKEQRAKQALFLEARESNRVEARHLSSRGSAKRTKNPNTPNRPLFGGLFRKKDSKNSPTEIQGMPPAPSNATPPTRSTAASKPSTPPPSTKLTAVPVKPVPKITPAPAPLTLSKTAPPPEPEPSPATETVPTAPETALRIPDVQVQPPAPTSEPSSDDYDGIRIIAESCAELQKGALVYEGNAFMKAPAFRIESNRISVGFTSAGDKIEEALAVGSVSVQLTPKGSRPPVSARSARAHFDPDKESITLSGWPEYSIGDERRIATTPDTVVVLFLDGRVETEGETKLGLARN